MFHTSTRRQCNVIGAYSSETPKKICKKKKGRNINETLKYAINGWAMWCFHAEEDTRDVVAYKECKLKLFEILGVLHSGRIKYDDVAQVKEYLIDTLITHSLLFPPTEQTYALHEIIHITENIDLIGPPIYSSMYMYERLNLFLKRMNKNKNNTFPSIVRNYAVRFNFFYFIIALFLIYICFKIAVYLLYYCSIFALILQ